MTPKNMRAKIAAVVVTYNRLTLLKENINALLSQSRRDFAIYVVDNHSTDGTVEYLRETCGETAAVPLEEPGGKKRPQVKAIFLEKNEGGAGGFYQGMQQAMKDGYDALWIMDDDTLPEPDSLEKLLEAADKLGGYEHIGYLASHVVWTDGSPCRMNGTKKTGESREGYDRITQGSFVSLLIPADTVNLVGFPIREYFIWGDDKEYTLRISDRKPCYFVADSRVIHKTATNEGSSISSDDSSRIDRYFYAYRNDYVTARNRGARDLLIYHLAFVLNICRILFKSDEKLRRIGVMQKGKKAGRILCEQKIHS
ncbi:MAG: glycosyltransferase family 2 protein [Lachnospiraceae bacterium]|nr:glycosyltransferase family 2 protein [Lachnospiraceae bacterium]